MDFSGVLIRRGNIFHSCDFKDIDHCKYFVIIGEDLNNYVGFFFINSNINISIQKEIKFFNMQMPIKRHFYEFLNYDSFIDAHAISTIPKDKLKNQISKGLTKFKGSLTQEDEKLLLESLRCSDLYSEYEKTSFFK